MAAIATAMLAHVRPGETILHSRPLYGGTELHLDQTLAPFGVKGVGFTDGLGEKNILSAAERACAGGRIAMIFIETPCNPMNGLVDIVLVGRVSEDGAAIEKKQWPIGEGHSRTILLASSTSQEMEWKIESRHTKYAAPPPSGICV